MSDILQQKGVDGMQEATVISRWGNSKGIRIPVEILKKAQIDINDKLFFEADEKTIILTRAPMPKKERLSIFSKTMLMVRFKRS